MRNAPAPSVMTLRAADLEPAAVRSTVTPGIPLLATLSTTVPSTMPPLWAARIGAKTSRRPYGVSMDRLDNQDSAVWLLLFEECGPANPFTLEHHHRDPLRGRDFLKRVAVHQQQVGIHARADGSDALGPAEQFRGVDGGRLQGHRHRNSGLHPELQLVVQRGTVEDHW